MFESLVVQKESPKLEFWIFKTKYLNFDVIYFSLFLKIKCFDISINCSFKCLFTLYFYLRRSWIYLVNLGHTFCTFYSNAFFKDIILFLLLLNYLELQHFLIEIIYSASVIKIIFFIIVENLYNLRFLYFKLDFQKTKLWFSNVKLPNILGLTFQLLNPCKKTSKYNLLSKK